MQPTFKSKTYIHASLIVACSMVLLSPCFYSFQLVDGIRKAKVLWIYMCIGVILIIFPIILFNKKHDYTISYSLPDLFIFLDYLFVIFQYIYLDHVNIISILNFSIVIIYYFLLKNLLHNAYRTGKAYTLFKLFLPAIFISFIFQLFFASFQYIGIIPSFNTLFRITGTFFNSGQMSLCLVAYLPFLYCIFSGHLKHKISKIISIAFILFVLLLVLYIIGYVVLSRTAVLAISFVIALTIISGYFPGRKFFFHKNKRQIMAVGFLILILGLFIYSLSIKTQSISGRILIWKVSEQMISNHLLIGVGLGNFAVVYEKYQSNYFKKYPKKMKNIGMLADNEQYACNDFIQILCEQGIIGFLLFISFLFSLLYATSKKYWNNSFYDDNKDKIECFSFIGVLLFIVFCLFFYPMEILSLALILSFYSASLSSILPKQNEIHLKKIHLYLRIIVFTFIVIAGAGLLKFVYHKRKSFKKLHNTYVYYSMMSFDKRNKLKYAYEMKSLYPQLNHYGLFLMLYGGALVEGGLNEDAIKELEVAKEVSSFYQIYILLGKAYENEGKYDNAEMDYSFVYYMIPKKIEPKYLLFNLYYKEKKYIKWKNMGNEIINFRPKVYSPYVKEIKGTVRENLKSMGDH